MPSSLFRQRGFPEDPGFRAPLRDRAGAPARAAAGGGGGHRGGNPARGPGDARLGRRRRDRGARRPARRAAPCGARAHRGRRRVAALRGPQSRRAAACRPQGRGRHDRRRHRGRRLGRRIRARCAPARLARVSQRARRGLARAASPCSRRPARSTIPACARTSCSSPTRKRPRAAACATPLPRWWSRSRWSAAASRCATRNGNQQPFVDAMMEKYPYWKALVQRVSY